MLQDGLIMYEDSFEKINLILDELMKNSKSECVFLVDKSGQLITMRGNMEQFDSTAFASLSAGNFAATSELAKLIGETEFSVLFHEGVKDSIHISIVAGSIIMVVVFRVVKTSLGLVRLEVKKSVEHLAHVLKDMVERSKRDGQIKKLDESFTQAIENEIDSLFKD
ncbi:MAG TPA: roadblock/LC7 domain-containing protein [Candidatus Mcinerneyibacteriales bacterium]|jgi:predicted regulator of Ras-like GTPase activity (Roadblock/LC7/MglB family)|nr:roadblock/LC7 domain-containing protein [Candidatus Mcinerneyibacteriales bacterium]HPJ70003.1 roadblock/LC7 domain-containing protein [Candidatus Mcinerneyibacteriales bacterium]HPQ88866.1 roadblock/LC7 domain-containing protein [Candidatus Mcinerneyibacteriales bacterium]